MSDEPELGYVYFLANQNKTRFKIGKAANLYARATTLGASQFDFTESFAIQLPSEADAYNVERSLHRLFKQWRLPKDAVLEEDAVPDAEGATEWFQWSIRERLLKYLADNMDILGGELIEAAKAQALWIKPSTAFNTQPVACMPRRNYAELELDQSYARYLCWLVERFYSIVELSSETVLVRDPVPGLQASFVGCCSVLDAAEFADLAAALKNPSVAGFRLPSLVESYTVKHHGERLIFAMDLTWWSPHHSTALQDEQLEHFFALDMSIPGWGEELSAQAHHTALAIRSALVGVVDAQLNASTTMACLSF